MIIECEQCRSKFNFDEGLLKEHGTRVRCSVCKYVFTAYPPEPEAREGERPESSDLEETVALDSPPILAEKVGSETGPDADFEKAFKEVLDEEPPAAVSPDQIPDEAMPLEGEAVSASVMEKDFKKAPEGQAFSMDEPLVKQDPRPEKRKSVRSLPIILVVVLVVLGGAAAVYQYAPDMLPESLSFLKAPQKEDVSDTGVARLSLGNVKGGFVQSAKEGQLFVIQGVVTNNYPKSRSFILVKGSLLDDKGQAVKTKMAYAGNTFTEEQLKSMSLEEINKELKNRTGREKTNFNVKPEANIPFTVVIENLPDNLSEFTIEAVSSSPEQP